MPAGGKKLENNNSIESIVDDKTPSTQSRKKKDFLNQVTLIWKTIFAYIKYMPRLLMAITLPRMILIPITILLTLIIILGIIERNKPDLEPWHRIKLSSEFNAEIAKTDLTLKAYFDREALVFEELKSKIYFTTLKRKGLNSVSRYLEGSPSDPANFPIDWNRTIQMIPEKIVGGVLFIHNVGDSPYKLKRLAKKYHEQGFYVLAIRLPGSGTTPGALVATSWQDWQSAVQLGARHISSTIGTHLPFHIVGQSVGATLSVKYAMDAITDNSLRVPDSLILISLFLTPEPFAKISKLFQILSIIPYFEKTDWVSILPEIDPFQYRSFSHVTFQQIYELTSALLDQIQHVISSSLNDKWPPIIAFYSNEDFWFRLRNRHLMPGMIITLDRFHIMDWFPRTPGLYHTNSARFARDDAFNHLHYGFTDSPIRDHAVSAGENRPEKDYTVVFTPEGKLSMLDGGIGSLRLKPIDIAGESHWLVTATSDGVVHKGVPIAIPMSFFQPAVSKIADNGSVCKRIYGKIEYLPDPISRLFDQTEMVQKVYARVIGPLESCEPTQVTREASVAVSFVSDYKGYIDTYATYVTFRPDVKGSFQEAVNWMRNRYVEGEYNGRIITDFDQTQNVFKDASLALSKVLDRKLIKDDFKETIRLMHAYADVDAYFDEIDRQELLSEKRAEKPQNVFISYAHAPEKETGWIERIRIHLEGLHLSGKIEWWDDSKLIPGDTWRREIKEAIEQCRVAILVITADFLASRFIRESELPLLLESAERNNTRISCIYGSDVHLSGVAERLRQFQFVNDRDMPLQALTESGRESVYGKLIQAVKKEIQK